MNNSRKNSKIVKLFLGLALNNNEMSQILCHDYKAKEEDTRTSIGAVSLEELALRLLDSRILKNPKKMREIAQEYHNKFSKSIGAPNLVVEFSDSFKEDPRTAQQLYKYLPLENRLVFNSGYDYSDAPCTFLLEQLTTITYMHRFQYDLKYLLKNYETLDNYKRYLELSVLLKNATMAILTEEGKDSERIIAEYEEDSSASSMVAKKLMYNKVKEYLEWAGIYNSPHLSFFKEEKEYFDESILGVGQQELEDGTIEDEEEYLEGYIDRALEYDLEMLKMLLESNFNARSKGEIGDLFLEKLNESSEEFYNAFGLCLELGFQGELEQYLESSQGALEIEDYEEYDQSEFDPDEFDLDEFDPDEDENE